MRFRRLVSLLAVLSLFVAACGDDDDTATSAATTAPAAGDGDGSNNESDDSESWDEGQRTADQETLDNAILTLDDMPTGWEQLPGDDDNDIDQEEVAECVGADVNRLYNDDDPEVDASFGSPDDAQLDVGWTTASTLELAEFRFETLTTDTALGCLRDVVVDAIEDGAGDEGITVGDVTLNRMSFPRFGDDSTAIRMTVPMTAQGMSIDAYVDAVFIRIGRATGTLTYLSIFSPADSAQVEGFVQAMVDKLDPDAVS